MQGTPLQVPGDKSISHRALLYAALAEGESRLRGISTGRDVVSSHECIRQLGIETKGSGTELIVYGKGLHGLREPDAPLECGNSGTTMRLLSGILSGQPFTTTLTGDASLNARPMKRIIEPLTSMGAVFKGSVDGFAPFSVTGSSHLQAIDYAPPVASAQVKSAILFAGLFAQGTTQVRERELTRDHTERLLKAAISQEGDVRICAVVPPARLEPLDLVIPGDPSSAAFLIAATIILGRSRTRITGVSINPTRTRFMDVLRSCGASIDLEHDAISHGEPYADLHVHPLPLSGVMSVDRNIPELIDEIPVLAVLCACSGVPFTLRNASELRYKESDRIALLVKNLRAVGCNVDEYEDGFASLCKNGLIGASIETRGDHRIVMAFGLAGLAVEGISIDDPSCVDVSFPGFWNILRMLGS